MNPELILFDLGDVVCHYVPERRLELLSAACGKTVHDVNSALYGSGLIDQFDQGEWTADRIHEVVRKELGFTAGRKELERIWCTAFEVNNDVLRLVRASRPRRTALFTNNDALLREALPWVMPQVTACFDELVFSCDLGAKKPEARAFEQALSVLSASAAETLFIDDKAANVAAAASLGIGAVRFQGVTLLTQVWESLFTVHTNQLPPRH